MSNKRRIEIFSAGCPLCEEAVRTVNRIACDSCEISVLDMHSPEVAARAAEIGISRVPTILVEGIVAQCCAGGPVDEQALRAAGIGVPIS